MARVLASVTYKKDKKQLTTFWKVLQIPNLRLEWGIEGLNRAMKRHDYIVIIDVLRFCSAVVTATSLGFVIKPSTERHRKKESHTLSPRYFFNRKPGRVTIFSSNGAFLAVSSAKSKCVIFGSLLNAKAVAEYISGIKHDVSLIAGGEISEERRTLMPQFERDLAYGNELFSIEDLLGAGAISYFSKFRKTGECLKAERTFKVLQKMLKPTLRESGSGVYDQIHGNAGDLDYCTKLNYYKVVPMLHLVKGVPEIAPAR